MPRKHFNEDNVAKLDLPEKGSQVDWFDTYLPGLVLRVNYGGRKTWRALYYVRRERNGRTISEPRTHALGQYPILSVKQARAAAAKFLADPQAALNQVQAGSFKEVAENFLKRHVSKLRSAEEIERALIKYVYPAWRDRPFTNIKRGDVTALLDQIEDNHGPRQADKVLAYVRKMMNWHATRSDDYVPPIAKGMKRNDAEPRERILDDDEIRAVWAAADQCGTFGALIKILLLTGQRLRKVTTLRWDDIDEHGTWIIRTEEREKGNAEVVKLPPMALAVIEALPRISGNDFVFAGRAGHVNDFSRNKIALDKHARLPEHWTLHDLRRTARSLMSRAKVLPDIAERALGHKIGGVRGIYDRHHYRDEKAEAFAKLAALVERIINPPEGDNVVDMPRKAG
jgi:integrase